MARIVAVQKDGQKITNVKLDNGTVYDIEQAAEAAGRGEIEGIIVGSARDGSTTIHTPRDPEDQPGKHTNLNDMPTF